MPTPAHAPDDEGNIGVRIARFRKAADLTQRKLADRAKVSLSLLSKVETGDKPASHTLVAAVAAALQIPAERLYGQPYDDGPPPGAIEELRAVLRLYDLPQDGDVATRPLAELSRKVDEISDLRKAGQYTRLGASLPLVLAQVSAAAHAAAGGDRHIAFRLLVSAYYAAHGLAYRLGYRDLSESIEHKLAWAAERTHDPLAVALADWTRVTSFQASGDYDHGLLILDRARAALTDSTDQETPAARTLIGSMHLRGVTLASRNGDAATVADHLAHAYRLADGLDSDVVHYHLTFGPENTRIHDVAAKVDLGDPAGAVQIGRELTPSADLPATRAGHHYIDLARAHLLTGDRPGAFQALSEARRRAPEQTRMHPLVRDTASVLLTLHRRSNPELTELVKWLGLS